MNKVDSKKQDKHTRSNTKGCFRKSNAQEGREGVQYNKGGVVRGGGVKTENVKTRVRVGEGKKEEMKKSGRAQMRESRGCG